MTETTTPIEQPAAGGPELSGVDLARVALHAAREATRKHGESEARAPRRRRTRVVQCDGREPAGFAAVLQGLVADRVWDVRRLAAPCWTAGPTSRPAIAPQLADHVAAVAFHPETGQLDLRPDSPAYATQLRLTSARIVTAANEAVRTDAVHSVRVLTVGAAPAPRTMPEMPATAPDTPPALVKTREMASPGGSPPRGRRTRSKNEVAPSTGRITSAQAESTPRRRSAGKPTTDHLRAGGEHLCRLF